MHHKALATFWKKTSNTHDRFDTKSTEMRSVIEAKRTALIVSKRSAREMNLKIRRAAKSNVQKTAWQTSTGHNSARMYGSRYCNTTVLLPLHEVLCCAFDTTTQRIYLRTHADGRLFNIARLIAKTRVRVALIGVCFMLVTKQLRVTPRRNSSHWWTGLHRPIPGMREGSTHFTEKHPCRILGISWQDKLSNADALSRAALPSMYTLLRQRRLRCLGSCPLYGGLSHPKIHHFR